MQYVGTLAIVVSLLASGCVVHTPPEQSAGSAHAERDCDSAVASCFSGPCMSQGMALLECTDAHGCADENCPPCEVEKRASKDCGLTHCPELQVCPEFEEYFAEPVHGDDVIGDPEPLLADIAASARRAGAALEEFVDLFDDWVDTRRHRRAVRILRDEVIPAAEDASYHFAHASDLSLELVDLYAPEAEAYVIAAMAAIFDEGAHVATAWAELLEDILGPFERRDEATVMRLVEAEFPALVEDTQIVVAGMMMLSGYEVAEFAHLFQERDSSREAITDLQRHGRDSAALDVMGELELMNHQAMMQWMLRPSDAGAMWMEW